MHERAWGQRRQGRTRFWKMAPQQSQLNPAGRTLPHTGIDIQSLKQALIGLLNISGESAMVPEIIVIYMKIVNRILLL